MDGVDQNGGRGLTRHENDPNDIALSEEDRHESHYSGQVIPPFQMEAVHQHDGEGGAHVCVVEEWKEVQNGEEAQIERGQKYVPVVLWEVEMNLMADFDEDLHQKDRHDHVHAAKIVHGARHLSRGAKQPLEGGEDAQRGDVKAG